jgi:hypothetical protein
MSLPLSNTARKFLLDLGYNITRSFSSSIAPLQVLDKSSSENVFELVGSAEEIFYHPQNVPAVKTGLTVDISGSSTENLSIEFTISFLKDFLEKIHVGKADLSVVFNHLSTFTTKFSGCSSDFVYPLETWKFLRSSCQGGINEDTDVTCRILDNTSLQKPAYIITETLKAKEIVLSGKNENGVIIKPNIEALQKILDIHGVCEYKVTDTGEISITNLIPPVFAFKACPIWIHNQTIVIAPPGMIPNPSDVAVSDIPSGYAFAEPSSLHNPEILTPVLLSRSGMPIRIVSAR